MKQSDFVIAICLVAATAGLVIRNGMARRVHASDSASVNPTGKAEKDPEKAARLAMLRKYSKPGPSYVAPEAQDQSQDPPQGQVDSAYATGGATFDLTPLPGVLPATPPAPNAPATTTPRINAPTSAATTPTTDDPNNPTDAAGGQGYAAPGADVPVPYDEYTRAISSAQLSDPYNLSDQQLLTGMTGLLTEDQRNTFQNMWASMTPDEQQEWLSQLRSYLQP